MIRPININLNAAHPELPLVEATTFTGAPSSVFIRGVPKAVGNWSITAVSVAVTYPDNTTTARAAVESAEGVWVATIPGTATSGRTTAGFRILADGIDENGDAVTGYVLGFADFSVLSFTPVPAPGGTFWLLRYFDTVPSVLHKGDVAKVDGVLKFYNGSAWEAFAGDIPAPSTATPAMDGTGAAGTSAAFARGDHVHPTDTSRMAASATGADIAVSGTDATKINAALAGKFDKSGGTIAASNDDPMGIVFGRGPGGYPFMMVTDGADSIGFSASTTSSIVTNRGTYTLPSSSGNLARAADAPAAGNLAALDEEGNPTDAGWTAGDLARYALVTKTISNNAVTLDDRAINAVAVSSSLASLTINFPTATSGRLRDFGLRLTVASGITTAPQIVLPQGVVCENADGEAPEIGADGAATILYFTETASGVFLVKGEVVTTIS